MKLSTEADPRIPPTAALGRELIEVQKTAILELVNYFGLTAESWEEFRAQAEDDESELSRTLEARGEFFLQRVTYTASGLISDVNRGRTPTYPVQLFGSRGIQLRESGTPVGYIEKHLFPLEREICAARYALIDVETPIKSLELTLVNNPSKPGQKRTQTYDSDRAVLLTAPDMPPVVMHSEDIAYEDENLSVDVETIQRVEDAFGPDSVIRIGNYEAQIIIDALRTAPRHVSIFEDYLS